MLRETFTAKFGHYPYQTDFVAECPNPNSSRSMIGFTYLHTTKVIESSNLQSVIDNAVLQLTYCPTDCMFATCQLRVLAGATTEELRTFLYEESIEETPSLSQ